MHSSRSFRFFALTALKIFTVVIVSALSVRAWILMPRVSFEQLASGEPFESPVHITNLPNEPKKFLVTEKAGKVKLIGLSDPNSVNEILDIRDLVHSADQEAGMLSAVMDPNFPAQPYLYVYYAIKNPLGDRIARFKVDPVTLIADVASQKIILQWEKFAEGHHGGHLLFGNDGYLWSTIGDGAANGSGNADKLRGKTLLGSIIRIDVKNSTAAKAYSIPQDNPFYGSDKVLPEIWAYGFRNPWRFGFSSVNNILTVGDVGENDYEEINVVEKGGDFGWPIMEGDECFPPKGSVDCSKDNLKLPLLVMDQKFSRSVTSGFVYDGQELKSLKGKYIFGDYIRGLFAVNVDFNKNEVLKISGYQDLRVTVLNFKTPVGKGLRPSESHAFVSIYEGLDKEVYLVDLNGFIYKAVQASTLYKLKYFFYTLLSFR
jgi:glucose/arabinose dehydrogenase